VSGFLGIDWTNPASLGYPVIFGGVLLGWIIPVVPTGEVVGAGAAIAVGGGDLNLALVVDRSGSMRGQKLADAKRAARELVLRLQAGARLALVHYGQRR